MFSLYPIPTSWLQAAAEQLKEELITVSCTCRVPSLLLLLCIFIYKLAVSGGKESRWHQTNSDNWHSNVSVPLSINTVEVEICWPLSSATLHSWEIPQGSKIVFWWGLEVYGAVSTSNATGRAPGEGGWGNQNSLANQCGSILKSTWLWRPVVLQMWQAG